ncbi:MAG: FG-GAP-like repeat-containing protein [Casimicrobiaceae bacterium]
MRWLIIALGLGLACPAGAAGLDAFWRAASGTNTGTNASWQFTGPGPSEVVTGFPPGAPASWQVKGTADVNADGILDIVWFEPASGQVAIWLMGSATAIGSASFPGSVGPRSDWMLAGIGDFDGDGHADLAWRNAADGRLRIWYLSPSAGLAGFRDYAGVPRSFVLGGVGDFDGNGVSDFLWFEPRTGQVAVYLLQADGTFATGFPSSVGAGNWRPVGIDDFDGDGRSDIFWRNQASGATAIWYMEGAALADTDLLVSVPTAEWDATPVRDLDGDGRAELLWHGRTNGGAVRWLMRGRHVPPATQTLSPVGPDWRLGQAARERLETLIAAGDIAECPGTPSSSHAASTAALVATLPGTVVTLGDNVYANGTSAEFQSCYAPTWGALRSRTFPSPGNHDYGTPNAAGYFDYFGSAAGRDRTGFYSFDVGDWHLVALNSNIAATLGSAQETWLRADLAANAHRRCTLAYWHHPVFSSGQHGNDATMRPVWKALVDFGADVVLTGHDHDYERFGPQDSIGTLDTSAGLRSFVVGTGGATLRPFATLRSNSEARDATHYGVLRLSLRETRFAWEFVDTAGVVRDTGEASCH